MFVLQKPRGNPWPLFLSVIQTAVARCESLFAVASWQALVGLLRLLLKLLERRVVCLDLAGCVLHLTHFLIRFE